MNVERLPEAEFIVMTTIWKMQTPAATKDILQALNLNYQKDWNVSTLQTLLTRLIKRSFLSSMKQGKERYYAPLVSQKNYAQKETADFLTKHYSGSAFSLVSTLLKANNITEKEIDKLKELLNKGSDND